MIWNPGMQEGKEEIPWLPGFQIAFPRSYTDKRTAVCEPKRRPSLDVRDKVDVTSAPYDQTNQIR
jgi:hypothetical protein